MPILAAIPIIFALQAQPAALPQLHLDFEFFKTRVQPIFTTKREGHARCISCHALRHDNAAGAALTGECHLDRGAITQELRNGAVESRFQASRMQAVCYCILSRWKRAVILRTMAAAIGLPRTIRNGRLSQHGCVEKKGTPPQRLREKSESFKRTPPEITSTSSILRRTRSSERLRASKSGHGAAVAGNRIYVSNEADSTLDVVDAKTLLVTNRIPLSGHPNNIAAGRDGKRVYVSIREGAGAVDVVDTQSLQRIKSIPVKGAVHNTYVTPDGKYVIAGSIAGKNITAIDAQTDQPVWVIDFDLGVRPIAFEPNADGSTKRMFVQLSDLNGFAVVDFATHKEVTRIKLPDLAAGKAPFEGGGNTSHGMAVTADGKSLVVCSRLNSAVYIYSLPDLKLAGSVEVGKAPDWVTLTPDSKSAYVANAQSNSVSVIDIKTIKEVTRIPVGQVPKRNITAMLP